MASFFDDAALAARVYRNVRGADNRNPLPAGWNEIAYTSGGLFDAFTAGAYKNGNDIVIALKGTDIAFSTLGAAANSVDDLASDLALGVGLGSTQLFQAALFYEQIKADPANAGCNITFTGHSLGGGLASIMSVWFNRSATTFDEAPFGATALNPIIMAGVSAYLALNGYSDSNFLSFIFDPLLYAERASQVTNYFTEGEFLEPARAAWPTVVGSDNPIVIGGGETIAGLTLHSMNLAAALLIQDKLRADTVLLPNLLPSIFDEKLYADDLAGKKRDFLTSILNDQINQGYSNANGQLAEFATDIEKLSHGGMVQSNDPLNKALIATAIEDYYFLTPLNTGHEFFQSISGGIQFDFTDIAATGPMLSKGRFQDAIAALAGTANSASLQGYDHWYVQAGDDPMTATGTNLNEGFIGGNGSDVRNGDGARF